MMNTICFKCNVEMRTIENGVTIAHEKTPNWIRSGDKEKCPECGKEVVVNMGDAYESENVDVDLLIKEALSNATVEVLQKPIDWMAVMED